MKRLLYCLLGALPALASLAHAADACKYPVIAELPIKFVGDAMQPAVDGTIDGTPAVMLVDTGAWASAMTMTGVQRRGLPLRITGQSAVGAGGSTTLYDVRLRELTAGPFRSGKTMVSVIASTGFAPTYDAIIGAPFLLSSDMEIRLAEKKLTFFQPDDCATTYLGYWDEPSVVLPFIYQKDQGAGLRPNFMIDINGKPMRAMIDTGASASLLSEDAARRAGIDIGRARKKGMMYGIGDERVQTYEARVDSIAIGEEVIHNATLSIGGGSVDAPHDVILGADFLRAHRVLFAMRQRKVYIAYLDGDAFPSHKTLAPWLLQEAEGGNPDAEMVLASAYGYAGKGHSAEGEQWLLKAAGHGLPEANTELGIQLMKEGKYVEAVAHIRAALDSLPADHYIPFTLYEARVLAGQSELAKKELAATSLARGQRLWPVPVVEFYLGKTDAAGLLAEAAKEPGAANFRLCEANRLMAYWYKAHGDSANEAARRSAARPLCERQS